MKEKPKTRRSKKTPDGAPAGPLAKSLASLLERDEELASVISNPAFGLLLNNCPDTVQIKDLKGRWLAANESALRLFKLQHKAYVGKTDADFAKTFPSRREMFEACARSDRAALRGREVRRHEEAVAAPDGSTRFFDVIKVPLKRASGRLRGLLVIGRDITDLRRAQVTVEESQAALAQTERDYELLLRNVPEVVYSMLPDDKGTITFITETWTDWTGDPIAEIYKDTSVRWKGVPPEDRKRVFAAIKEARKLKKRYEVEYHLSNTKDGTERNIHDRGEPVLDARGRIIAFHGVASNVTRLKTTEAQLLNARDSLASLVENIPEGLYAARADGQGSPLFVSGRWLEWTGLTRKQFLKNPNAWADSIHPEDREKTLSIYAKAIKAKRDFECEYRVVNRKTGEIRIIRDHGSPKCDEEGRVVLVEGIGTDITQLKRTEEELRHSQATLEERVEARTAELRRVNEALVYEVERHKRTEEALRESEALSRSILHAEPDVLLVLEKDGTYRDVFTSVPELLAKPAKQMIGKTVHEVLPSEEAQQIQAVIDTTVSSRVLQECEYPLTVRSKERWFAARVVPLVAGGRECVLWVARDITEQRRLERAIIDLTENERRRIGRDMHDGIGQHLTGLGYMCSILEEDLRSKELPEADRAADISRLIAEAAKQVRSIARGLNPLLPDPENLVDAIAEMSEGLRTMFGLSSRFTCPESIVIEDPTVASHLYRIAQEAVTNAGRHASPSRIDISLAERDDKLIMKVSNDGKFFPKRLPAQRGMGLNIMRYRARAIGGKIDVRQGRKSGTIVTVEVPL